MKLSKLPAEDYYYPRVRKWLESRGYYCGGEIIYGKKPKYYHNIGPKAQRVDVVGVKHIGNKNADELEIVAVEVRTNSHITIRDISDTRSYYQFAHRAYLAVTAKPTDANMREAEANGIGLLKLRGKKVIQLLEPKFQAPDPTRALGFLRSLGIVRCTLCQCFFHKFDYGMEEMDGVGSKSFYLLVRAPYFETVGSRTDPLELEDTKIKQLPGRITRFVCRKCVRELRNLIRMGKADD